MSHFRVSPELSHGSGTEDRGDDVERRSRHGIGALTHGRFLKQLLSMRRAERSNQDSHEPLSAGQGRVLHLLALPLLSAIVMLGVGVWTLAEQPGTAVSQRILLAAGTTALALLVLMFHLGRALVHRNAEMAQAQRQALAAVAQSEAHFRSLFELATVGISVTDERGRFLSVNPRMLDLLGYTREEELLGRNHHSVTLPADVEPTPSGEVTALVSMAQDITESQQMLSLLNESEARFRGIFNQAAVGIALLDAQGSLLNVNQKLCEILGYSLDELLATTFAAITHPDDLQRDLHLSHALLDGSLDQFSIEKRYVHRDARIIWAMLFVRRIDAPAGEPPRFVSVIEDISERKAAEERVQALTASLESQVVERTEQLRERVRAGQRRNEELALITDMGRLLSASSDPIEATQVVMRYLPRIFPLADGALYLEGRRGGLFERQVHWGDATLGAGTFTAADCWALRSGEIHHVEGAGDPLHCVHASAESHAHSHVCVPVLSLGQPLGLIELGWGDVGQQWAPEMTLVKTVAETIGLALGNLRLREELSRQALTDPLTGVHNRRWLDQCLRERVSVHARNGQGFALLMIDVDHFKLINDSYGHEAGDRALHDIAQSLQRAVRDHESAARFGGEEFAVVLPGIGRMEALAVGERLRQNVAALEVRSNDIDLRRLTISVGVALYPEDGASAQAVVEAADAALYRAKQGGRNRVCGMEAALLAIS